MDHSIRHFLELANFTGIVLATVHGNKLFLAKDYNKAKNTLANVERPDAYTDYLMAVLGARTNNSSMVTSSLKSAVAKDPSLAKKAATDLEFAKYFTNADFMSIAK